MHACMHAYIHTYTYIGMHKHTQTHTNTNTHTHNNTHTHTRAYTHAPTFSGVVRAWQNCVVLVCGSLQVEGSGLRVVVIHRPNRNNC